MWTPLLICLSHFAFACVSTRWEWCEWSRWFSFLYLLRSLVCFKVSVTNRTMLNLSYLNDLERFS
ncbi:hypothetical protein KC19_3G263200 [Ceratodon purpureus]|uniref:Secreted protein n=1 Tax=Ceratodon purpureus TaxID=3225 RepID=A0A8T0IRY7_CERPU|nr:hypothetical protein KC19_3G263200 [Ceratodon purpureus]